MELVRGSNWRPSRPISRRARQQPVQTGSLSSRADRARRSRHSGRIERTRTWTGLGVPGWRRSTRMPDGDSDLPDAAFTDFMRSPVECVRKRGIAVGGPSTYTAPPPVRGGGTGEGRRVGDTVLHGAGVGPARPGLFPIRSHARPGRAVVPPRPRPRRRSSSRPSTGPVVRLLMSLTVAAVVWTRRCG